jgi:VWFA-related protein
VGSAQIPQNGLVAYYPFDGNANDASGNGRNGVISGATFTNDRFGNAGKAILFDGNGAYVEIPGTESLNFETGGLSMSTWIRLDGSQSDRAIIGKHIPGDFNGYALTVTSDGLQFFVANYSYAAAKWTTTLGNNWHHLVGTYDGVSARLYLDGALVASAASSYTSTNSTTLKIGSWNTSGYPLYFIGAMDQIRIYSRALSISEVSSLYNEANSPPSSLTVVYNQIVSSSFPTIRSYVTVMTSNGSPVTGLSTSNFSVREDGVNETLTEVSSVGNAGTTISVALVVDRSGSMLGQSISDAKAAAMAFVNLLQTTDKSAVISFSDLVNVDCDFTTNKSTVVSAINGLTASGSTALFDAVYESVNRAALQSDRKAVIALTDGADNASTHTIDQAITQAKQQSVPIFTIGLGLTSGSTDEQNLQRIAQETGGQYYRSPSSSDLLQIYQQISQQLQNQYLITYSTHHPARDGSTRTVSISATYNNQTDTKQRTYTAPTSTGASIMSVVSSSVSSGSDFSVDIKVGDPSSVSNLFGVSFVLIYTNTSIVDYVSATAGPFLGSDLLFYPMADDPNGKVSVGISRKAPANGVSGSGVIVSVKFHVLSTAPNGSTITFTLTGIAANDPNGNQITLSPVGTSTNVASGLTVWPGDTNNDLKVDQADVLPIGLYWGSTGSARSNASSTWIAQTVTPWSTRNATYADANGDGVVNQADILPIGLNWGQVHTQTNEVPQFPVLTHVGGTPSLRVVGPSSVRGRSDFSVDVMAGDANNTVSNLFGISFVVDFAASRSFLQATGVTQGTFLGSDVVFFSQIDVNSGTVSCGITRKAGQGGINGTGTLARINMRIVNPTSVGAVTLSTRDIAANDPGGNALTLLQSSSSTLVAIDETTALPTVYQLSQNFPNPFNPSTRIRFVIPKTTHVLLAIVDALGRTEAVLVNGEKAAGSYETEWNASNAPSGIYFYRLQAGEFLETKKMILLK